MGLTVSKHNQKLKQCSHSLTRAKGSYHNLKDRKKQFITKKWVFNDDERSNQLLEKLISKKNNPLPYLTNIVDVTEVKMQKGKQVRAKIEFTDKSIKTLIDKKIMNKTNFSLIEIWNMVQQILYICKQLKSRSIQLPINLSSYLLFSDRIKIKDEQLLPNLKVQRTSRLRCGWVISRTVVNIALLKDQCRQISLSQINQVNIKYNVNLATFLYCLKSQKFQLQEIIQLWTKLKLDWQSKIEKVIFRPLTQGTVPNKRDPKSPSYLFKQVESSCVIIQDKMNSPRSNIVRNEKQLKTIKEVKQNSSSSSSLSQLSKFKMNLKRIQEICPKVMKASFQINQQTKCQDDNLHKNSARPTEDVDKENAHNYLNQPHDQQIKIKNHQFPKFIHKNRRNNFLIVQDKSQEQFMKLTNGQRCILFPDKEEQELLQSIIQSQQSIIIKNDQSPSPLLSIDQQIEQINQDFLKMFQPGKMDTKSVVEFVCHRNSTIMQLTEENQQSANQFSVSKIISNRMSPSNISKFQMEQNVQEQESQKSFDGFEEEIFVIEEYEGGSKYQGYIKNGLRNGFGKLYYEDGGSYEGSWRNGQIQGFGKLYYQSGQLAYQGYWIKGQFHGEGKIINERPEKLPNNFSYHDLSQIGTSWNWYEGNFQNDQKNGFGIIQLENGDIFKGFWVNNIVQGQGQYLIGKNKCVIGVWANNILIEMLEQKEEINNDIQF